MPPKPFIQVVKVDGAEEAIQAMRDMGVEVEVVGDKTEESGKQSKKADETFGSLANTFGLGVTAITSMVGSLIGTGGLLSALQENSEEAKQLKADLEGVIDAMTATIALTGNPKFVQAAKEIAIESGRDLKEVGAASFPIVSGTSGATVEEQIDILRQAGELAKTEPTTPLESFANALVGLRGATGGKFTPQQLQNLAVSTADLAVTDFEQLGNTLPAVLGVAGPSGATVPEAASLFAQLTTSLGTAEASTAAKNILSRLAAPSDTGRKVLSSRGVPEGATPFEALEILAESGALSALDVRDLLGEGPAAAGLPAVLDSFAKIEQDRASIELAIQPGAPDLGQQKIESLSNNLAGFSDLERQRKIKQETAAKQREQEGLLQTALVRAAFEKALVEQGFSAATRKSVLEGRLGGLLPGFDQFTALGLSPGTALSLVAPLDFNQAGIGTPDALNPISVADFASRFVLNRTAGIESTFRDAAPNTFPADRPREKAAPAKEAQVVRIVEQTVNNITNINTQYADGEAGVETPPLVEVGD